MADELVPGIANLYDNDLDDELVLDKLSFENVLNVNDDNDDFRDN